MVSYLRTPTREWEALPSQIEFCSLEDNGVLTIMLKIKNDGCNKLLSITFKDCFDYSLTKCRTQKMLGEKPTDLIRKMGFLQYLIASKDRLIEVNSRSQPVISIVGTQRLSASA